MCGIAGFVTRQPFRGPASILERMTGVIAHRGPDAAGYYRDEWAQLGHRRLSIIDVAAGAQPMFNETGSLCIVYNGEVFNHADVRPEPQPRSVTDPVVTRARRSIDNKPGAE